MNNIEGDKNSLHTYLPKKIFYLLFTEVSFTNPDRDVKSFPEFHDITYRKKTLQRGL